MKKIDQIFKIIVFCLPLIAVVSIDNAPAEDTQNIWRFEDVELGPDGAHYSLRLEKENSTEMQGVHVPALELQLVAKHLGVNSPEELIGKTVDCGVVDCSRFPNQKESTFCGYEQPELWINETAVKLMHKGDYHPPSGEALEDRAAQALAKMQLPDYSDVFRRDMQKAFGPRFYSKVPFGSKGFKQEVDQAWLDSFKDKILKYSNGKVVLTEPTEGMRFDIGVQGTAAYLILKNNETGEIKGVIIGPYSDPVMFAKVTLIEQ